MPQEFFVQRPKVNPTIYAYRLVGVPSHEGYLKIGYTDRDAETRVREQLHTSGIAYRIVLEESAMRADGTCFLDHDIHAVLRRKGFPRLREENDKNEWFRCEVRDVIAAINGFALGGGCELAMACDIRIASEKAKFGQPEVKLGIIPGFSGTYRLPKLVGQGYAKELIYSGRMIDGKEALRIGLVNHLLPAEELMDYVLGLARDIVANAPVAVRYAKTCINDNYDMDGRAAIEYENGIFAECFSTADQKEGMNAFLEKRKANFRNS